jgi:TatD DNase family protein
VSAADEPAVFPDLGAAVTDTHAHLDMLEDPVAALEHAGLAGVAFVATVADATEEPERTFEGVGRWRAEAAERIAAVVAATTEEAAGASGATRAVPEVRIIVGVHPHNASGSLAVEARLRGLVLDPAVCGIGEVGLDFHYDHSPRDDQRAAMRRHLRLAHEVGLPVCVHLREAHEEGLAILLDEGIPAAGCVIHCFTEGPEWAERFLAAGCLIAFGGVATFPKADAVREAAAMVPLDRMLVETDCPFLAPAPYRGRTNEPAFVTITAARLAEVKGIDTEAFAEATTANALRLYGGRRP